MKITNKILAAMVFVFFITGISGTIIFNLWQTENTKDPAKYEEGEFAGMSNPKDIRGSYTLEDIKKAFDVDVEILGEAFVLDNIDDLNNFKCRELEEMYGDVENGEIGTDSVRLFVALYKNLPYTPEEDTLLLSPALTLLKDKVSEGEFLKLKKRTLNLPQSKTEDTTTIDDVKKDAENKTVTTTEKTKTLEKNTETTISDEDRTIKGKTTFGELKSWGLSDEEIEKAIGQPMGKSGESIRDFCKAKDIEFSTIKSELQKLVDSKK